MSGRSRFERLTQLQVDHPGRVLLPWVLLAVLSLPFLLRLGLNSDWIAMLPDDRPSVRDLELIGDSIGGTSTLTVAVSSSDREAMKRFVTDLVPRLKHESSELILRIDWNTRPYEDFVEAHRHLFVPLPDLTRLRDDLRDRVDFERAKANPLYVWLDDTEPPTLDQIFERAEESVRDSGDKRHPDNDGFFMHPAGDLVVVFVRSTLTGGDMAASQQLQDEVNAVVGQMNPGSYAPDLHVDLAGDIPEALEEQKVIAGELIVATSATIILVLATVLIFFRSKRAVPLLALSLSLPVIVTFGMAQILVEYLNTSTAFLGAIVIGNGVNPNIIWLARYFEERRAGLDMRAAILRTHVESWSATLTASLAAAVAYGSLVLTDFRGFRDFGIIGGAGMVLCWVASMTLLPALVVLFERRSPMRIVGNEANSVAFGTLFARLVVGAPRSLAALSAVLGLVFTLAVAKAVASDPLEYDLNNLRSPSDSHVASRINDRMNEFIARTATGTVVAMLAPTEEAAIDLEQKLEARRDSGDAYYGNVNTIRDLLPRDVPDKRKLLKDVREALLDVRKYASEEDQKRIDDELPAENPPDIGLDDLPPEAAALFSEQDGKRGRLIFIEQAKGANNWDGRYLVSWTEDARQVVTAAGEHPPLAGRPPIFADVFTAIWYDGPTAIAFSLSATILLLFFAFRSMRRRGLALGALLLGIAWMGGTMAVFGMKLNFLNFVAFPITFGNGADYGVNVIRRYDAERSAGLDRVAAIRVAVEQSGGAVILCSVTTVIGYMSLYSSANMAINSFGAAMAISEVTCVMAAVVSLPAFIVLTGGGERHVAVPSGPPPPLEDPAVEPISAD